MLRFVKFLFILMVILLTGALTGWLVVSLSMPGEVITTPDFKGMSLVDALKKAEENGLFLSLLSQEFDASVPSGSVIRQKPEAGLGIKKGRKVHVVVSRGVKEVVVPDLADLPWREVESYLATAGLGTGLISRAHTRGYERDKIIAQQPPAGQLANLGDKVNILVSLGPHYEYYLTPDWIGRNITSIRNEVTSMNLRLEITERKVVPDLPSGTILNQFPKPGFRSREGDIVRVTVSRNSRLEDDRELDYVPFLYIVPAGLFPQELKIILVSPVNEEIELLKQEVLPGQRVSMLVPKKQGSYLKIYLNDVLVAREEPGTAE